MSRAATTALGLVLAVAALLYLPFLGSRDFWAPDEPRHAQAAVEMIEGGHWWYPHVNGNPYPDKPPLYFWSAAVASLPGRRVTEATARLPAALAALLLVAVTWDLGRRLSGPLAGTLGALILATTWLPSWMARRVSLDMMLATCTTVAIWCAIVAGETARAREGRSSALAWSAGAGLACALGVMTKGPVALLPVAAVVIVAAWHPALRAARPSGFALQAGVVGVAAALLVLTAWLVPAWRLGGYDPFGVVSEHVVDRVASGRDHVQPVWYYLGSFPADFMPWTLLALPAYVAAWRSRPRTSPADALLLGWLLLPLMVLTVVVEKRNVYVLPLFPAVALLTGRWLGRLATLERLQRSADERLQRSADERLQRSADERLQRSADERLQRSADERLQRSADERLQRSADERLERSADERPPRAFRVASLLVAGTLGAVGMAAGILAMAVPRLESLAVWRNLPLLEPRLAALGLAALGGSVLAGSVAARSRDVWRVTWFLALAVAATELATFALLPAFDPVKSARAMGEAMQREATGAPLALYPDDGGSRWDAYVHYGRRRCAEIPTAHQLEGWLASVQRPAYVLTNATAADLPSDGHLPPETIFGDTVGHRSMLLLRYARPALPEQPSRDVPAGEPSAAEPDVITPEAKP